MVLDNYGGECIGYSEVDKYAIKNYESNFPNKINYGDITKINEKELPKFDLLIGGSPCQNISIMRKTNTKNGKVEGLRGNESKLFYDYIRILNEQLPKWFIFENVRNLLHSNDGEDFKIVKECFEGNYNIKYQIMNTSDYGLPHTRRRLYIVGQRKDLGDFDYKFPTEIELKLNVQDLLEKDVNDKYYLTDKMYKTVMSWGTGGWKAKPETDLKIARPLTATMAKMHRASCDNYYHTEYKPQGKTNLRRLTPRECARLQGLPNTYKIVISDTQAYKLMGNAMSYNVVDNIFKELQKYILKLN
ncbi:cytosine-specific DNA methyltransferase [Clostridium botulinum]|uniref:Cytosine-specific methyltransferase n=2 Tax=Clostridium botulinum TaxID=1491 RepID=A0A9Q1UW07_CLOBO|nr:cytosine-specific DNA methyltransferase [Clostridium botulinum]KOA80458.1 cytosine-specific DNA methyltransferase [Clostridium botulinum]KOA82643.1 cytosine-specific DNA methyltransferase [Clostridium botulinum]KOA84180.1 cytosine-specific DNA methyltransferase [Clostridium botulinum]KOA84411.1 cytosine-specific DNA methyltransferase [Clostridium botulinum]